jgi:hypothetical protein
LFIISFHFKTAYSTNSFSISSIFSYHQIFSIYSKAFRIETAHVTFGVPSSNFSGSELLSLYSYFFTQDIAPHPEKTGFRLFNNSLFARQIHNQESAITL